MKERLYLLKIIRYILIGIFFIFAGIGFFHMFFYENSDTYYSTNVNAYVGGDAYNYIINATRATAYFVISFGSLISVFLNEILMNIIDKNSTSKVNDNIKDISY